MNPKSKINQWFLLQFCNQPEFQSWKVYSKMGVFGERKNGNVGSGFCDLEGKNSDYVN